MHGKFIAVDFIAIASEMRRYGLQIETLVKQMVFFLSLSFYNASLFIFLILDDERLSESLEETRASLLERCEELFADKYGKDFIHRFT